MTAPTTRRFTPARIVAFALILVVVAGLGYLRFAPDAAAGWFTGVLIVLTTKSGVPLDDELLATVPVGLTVGLGIYLAWMSRDRPARTKATGCAAAIAGALLGGWLGFHATDGLAALLTTLVGATVGANLLLLVLDLVEDPLPRDPSAVHQHRADAEPYPLSQHVLHHEGAHHDRDTPHIVD